MPQKASFHVRQARTSSTYARQLPRSRARRGGARPCRNVACARSQSPESRRGILRPRFRGVARPRGRISEGFRDTRRASFRGVACPRGRSRIDLGDLRRRPPCGPRPHRHRSRRRPARRPAARAAARPRKREGAPEGGSSGRNVRDSHRRAPRRARPHGAPARPLRAVHPRSARGAPAGRPGVDRRAFRRRPPCGCRPHRARRCCRARAERHVHAGSGEGGGPRARERRSRRRRVGRPRERVRDDLAHHRLRPHLGDGVRAGLHDALQLLPGGEHPAQPALRAGGGRHARDGVSAGVPVGEKEAGAARLQRVRLEPAHHRGRASGHRLGAVHAVPLGHHLHAKLLLRPSRNGHGHAAVPVLRHPSGVLRRERHPAGPAEREPRLSVVGHRARGEQRHRHRHVRPLRAGGAARPAACALYHRRR